MHYGEADDLVVGLRRTFAALVSSARAIDGGAVVDAMDDDELVRLDDLVDNPVRTSTRRMHVGEFTLQRPTDSMRAVQQCSKHELDDCSGGTFWESSQLALGWSGDSKLVGLLIVSHRLR